MTHKQSNPDWDLRNVRAFSEKGQLMRWLDVMKITDYHDQVATYQGEWLYVFDLAKPPNNNQHTYQNKQHRLGIRYGRMKWRLYRC